MTRRRCADEPCCQPGITPYLRGGMICTPAGEDDLYETQPDAVRALNVENPPQSVWKLASGPAVSLEFYGQRGTGCMLPMT
jgi:hypothetical protein